MAILYKANETDFNHLGLGPLNDAVSVFVTEERNGVFELEMKYPVDGARFEELKLDRIIKADAGYELKNQRFKIIRISKPLDGTVTVYGEHVSYLTQDLALRPVVNYSGNAQAALNTWKNSIVDTNPFMVASDITTQGSGTWSIQEVKNPRQALGGVRGSLLESYGGEYKFDNYSIRLMAQRGINSGALIAYGRNLVDLEQEEAINETYTSVYPYSVYQDENNKEVLLTLPEYFIDSDHVNNFARRKILQVDFSEDEIKTVESLRSATKSYIKANNVGIPKVNLRIKYIDLAKTLDYQGMRVEQVNLCDNVMVYFEKFDINTTAKVIKTVWDDILKQYDSVEIGEARSSLSQSIGATVDGKLETVVQRLNTIQFTADGKNVIHRGPQEPPPGNIGDMWYEPDGDFEVMHQWDGTIWKVIFNTRDLDEMKRVVGEAIEQADLDREKAEEDFETAISEGIKYADSVTTVDVLKAKVLTANVITSDMIKTDTALINKLFATDANINVLTSKSAFINSVKAVDIVADRITGGTFNGATMNIINLNANAIASGTVSGANSDWNLNTGVQTFTNPSSRDILRFNQGQIEFQNGSQRRYLKYNDEGLEVIAAYGNTGTSNNTSLHLRGGGNGSYQYIQFIEGGSLNRVQRLEAEDGNIRAMVAPGGEFEVRRYDTKALYNMRAGQYTTYHTSGYNMAIVGDRIETPRDNVGRNIYIIPNGVGSVIAGNQAGTRYNMVASDFVKQSSRETKTNIVPLGDGLSVIRQLLPVLYQKKDKLAQGIFELEKGFIAEDSVMVATPDRKGIYDSHITAHLVKAVQELEDKINQLEEEK